MTGLITDWKLAYLLLVNGLASFFFLWDKRAAITKRRRVPEQWLHFLELLGGILFVLILMYTIHHKNKKVSYWFVSWFILLAWLAIVYFLRIKV